MEIVDIKEILDYLKSKIIIIMLITLLVTILGVGFKLFVQEPKYSSSTTILLISNNSTDATLTYNDLSVNKNLVSTYSEIVKSKRVLSQVIKNLDLDYSYSELNKKVDVSSVTNTELIKITVTDTDRKVAKDIANETAKVFSLEIPELYNISNVNILDKAEKATTPSNMNFVKELILFIIAGLVLGLGIVIVIYYFDRTIKSTEQIETKIGLSVLGTVQEYKGAK